MVCCQKNDAYVIHFSAVKQSPIYCLGRGEKLNNKKSNKSYKKMRLSSTPMVYCIRKNITCSGIMYVVMLSHHDNSHSITINTMQWRHDVLQHVLLCFFAISFFELHFFLHNLIWTFVLSGFEPNEQKVLLFSLIVLQKPEERFHL